MTGRPKPHTQSARDQVLAVLRAEGPLSTPQVAARMRRSCRCLERGPALATCHACKGSGQREWGITEVYALLAPLERAGQVGCTRLPREANIWHYVLAAETAAVDETFRQLADTFRDS